MRRLLVGGDSPSTFFFQHHLRAAFAGRSLHQIFLLPAPSQTALNALPPFYRSVIVSWFRLPRFIDAGTIFVGSPSSYSRSLSTLTVAFVYRLLSTLARTEHRCVAQYQSWGMAVEWNTVWSNLSLWRFLRPVRDTNWLIPHGVLPTADRLLRFGMSVDSKCHCGAVESLVHLFAQCPVARCVFAWYQSLVHRAFSSSVCPSPSQLLVGYDCSCPFPPVFPCLLGIIRHRLWIARNAYRFDGSLVVYSSLLASVKSSLRFIVRLQQCHCPQDLFVTSWLAGGILGYLSDENFIVFHRDYQ